MESSLELLTLGCGMKRGGMGTVLKWTEFGAELLGRFPLAFEVRGKEKWYDLEALKSFWAVKRPELNGCSLTELISQADGFALSAWGADVAVIDLIDGVWVPRAGINYPTTLKMNPEYHDWVVQMDARHYHSAFGGAAQAGYQPVAQLKFMKDRGVDLSSCGAVVPMTDYLLYTLTGIPGCDQGMLQSQGLLAEGANEEIARLLDCPNLAHALRAWEQWDSDTILKVNGGRYVMPGLHDSPSACATAYADGCWYTWWTGSWNGVALKIDGLDLFPNEQTLAAGCAFEGLNPRGIVRNTGMFGDVYAAFRDSLGLSYEDAASMVLEQKAPKLIAREVFTTLELPDAVSAVIAEAGSKERALAAVVRTAVEEGVKDLRILSAVSGVPIEEVRGVGGWTDNVAACHLMRQHVDLVTGPNDAFATDVGVAAECIRRICRARGAERRLGDILKEFPLITS